LVDTIAYDATDDGGRELANSTSEIGEACRPRTKTVLFWKYEGESGEEHVEGAENPGGREGERRRVGRQIE
jgi:hypothetical protein